MRKRHRRRVLRAVFIGLGSVLLLLCLGAGGLYAHYRAVDETQVPQPQVLLGETVLRPTQIVWDTPVLGGLTSKPYSVAAAASAPPAPFAQSEIFITVPQDVQAKAVIADAQGAPLTLRETQTGFAASAPRNGTYSLHLTLEYPRQKGAGGGSLTYDTAFVVQAPVDIAFSQHEVPQGGVYTVVVTNPVDDSVPVLTQPLGKTLFAKRGDAYVAAIGVGYRVAPGEYPVTVQCGAVVQTQTMTVTQTQFARQDMTISGSIAGATNTAAANKEWRDAIYPLYETADDTVYWNESFVCPVAQRVLNTEYGLFRYTNGSPNAERHAGIDLDGETGDRVGAAAAGRVALAQFLTLTGNTVVIEHGGGLKTYYFHMDALQCAQDEQVEAGQQIGTVGTTGYSTGAHLHFEVKLGTQSIDPIALMDGVSGLYFAQPPRP